MADVALDNPPQGFLYLGQENVTLDERHRCPIPMKYVKRMHELFPDEKDSISVFVSYPRLPQRCLVVYPKQYWMARYRELLAKQNSPETSIEVLKRINLIMGATHMETLDGQNRIKLNPMMTSQVGILPSLKLPDGGNQSSIVVVGTNNCIELWQKSEYVAWAAGVAVGCNTAV